MVMKDELAELRAFRAHNHRNGTLDRGLDTKHAVFVTLRTIGASAPSPFLYWISKLNGIFKIMSFGGLTDLAT